MARQLGWAALAVGLVYVVADLAMARYSDPLLGATAWTAIAGMLLSVRRR